MVELAAWCGQPKRQVQVPAATLAALNEKPLAALDLDHVLRVRNVDGSDTDFAVDVGALLWFQV